MASGYHLNLLHFTFIPLFFFWGGVTQGKLGTLSRKTWQSPSKPRLAGHCGETEASDLTNAYCPQLSPSARYIVVPPRMPPAPA